MSSRVLLQVFIVHDPPPALPCPRSAHLYLSANYHIQRLYSRIFYADMDLPRDSLIPEVFCKQCAIQDVLEKIEKEDGPNGETKAEEWKEKSGLLKQVWKVKSKAVDLDVFYIQDSDRLTDTITVGEQGEWVVEYEGPLRRIRTDVGYQNPIRGRPYCKHVKQHDFGSSALHPSIARVRIVAKNERRNCGYISREAKAYMNLPDHFFEHWSGYNVIPPLRDPVPIGPLVPQFYGIYDPVCAPDEPKLSSIMLLEDCGELYDPWRTDDMYVATLLFKFSKAYATLVMSA